MDRHIAFAGVLIAVALAGCASTPPERQEATQESLVELRDAAMATRGQIEQTLGSLITLVRTSPDDMREAYRRYAEDADAIARQAARIEAESRQMDRRSEAWLSKWRESYADVQNPELRTLTEKRREQVMERFDNIEGSLVAAREAFQPFVRNLQDIKQVVGNDLTPRGVAAVSGTEVVRDATESGREAANALTVTIEDLNALIESLTPASPA